MKKQTLKFPSIKELSSFVKPLSIGYLINTNTLTITAKLPDEAIKQTIDRFNAIVMETNQKVYNYD